MRMTLSRKILVKTALASVLVAAFAFISLFIFTNRQNFFKNTGSGADPSMEPLSYESLGNFPPLDQGQSGTGSEKEYTLEIGTCNDKGCITKTLGFLAQKGVDAFYTPSKKDGLSVFHIRRGIFTSRQSAEKAQALLSKDKKINASVVEL
uniref:SPOR domain-containing protein n=1 Tax=uncultured bacterium Ak20-3 TaxID=798570 RepID=D9MX70_9BACT|nr:hypothetical protein AKSOIL_0339 [uncultured bacterium Ak20-3]